MTRQSKPVNFKWYAGIIVSLSLLYIYMPMLLSGTILEWDNLAYTLLLHILLIGCSACAVISTFLTNTKYYNILPNQSKGVSSLFRGLSWFGQFIVWATYVIAKIVWVMDK
jgi:hypothetical protein